jgi:hypothetical protein
MIKRVSFLGLVALDVLIFGIGHSWGQTTAPATQPAAAAAAVGEKVPSEDAVLKNFHSLGLVNGEVDIFRSACPVRDLGKEMATTQPTDEEVAEAAARMQRLRDLGIRTDISFLNPVAGHDDDKKTQAMVNLEEAAVKRVGLNYISFPMSNKGPNSLESMSDKQVEDWLDQVMAAIFQSAKTGGVVFHCSAGHDRTGLVAAYIRVKYQGWPVEQAIDEMRRYGHNWVKYSADGGITSWHEDHLRAIAAMLKAQAN